jgi:predicted dehydrogenase
VLKETGLVFQVGSQQRSAPWFRRAVALARSGILGNKLTAVVALGRGKAGGPFRERTPPAGLDWDFWLGQAPAVPYIPERCHKSFRWWLEYSGGEVTNWGAHHLDIAQWGLGAESTGPVEIEGHGVFDDRPNCYNTAQKFNCTMKFANGNTIILTSNEFTKEQFLAVDISHMENFVNCIRENTQPVSGVPSTHRTITSCHLANIAMRLERKLRWDPVKEDSINDPEASSMVARPQRVAYAVG